MPVGLRFGRFALHIGHHDQTVGEVPAVRGRDRHRHRHPFTVEVSQQLGLPREVGVAAPAEPTDRELPVDAHAPHLVDANSAGERFDTGDVVAPLIECLPSHADIFAEVRASLQTGWPQIGPKAPPTVAPEKQKPYISRAFVSGRVRSSQSMSVSDFW
jgi:hypothetical protein